MQSRFLLTAEERIIVRKYYSANMRRLREALGMYQEELAFALGTTQRHISEIENGKARISWTLVLAFSSFLQQYPELWQTDKENLLFYWGDRKEGD